MKFSVFFLGISTLEGYKIISLLNAENKSALVRKVCDFVGQKRFRPKITTNRMARLCMTGETIPEEFIDPAWGHCPLLSERECPVYPVRPFGCRSMMSKTICAETGYADIDEFVLTVASLFNQVVEHIDAGGMTGNLIDVFLFLDSRNNCTENKSGRTCGGAEGMIPNICIPVLMIPPHHRKRIQPLVESLMKIERI